MRLSCAALHRARPCAASLRTHTSLASAARRRPAACSGCHSVSQARLCDLGRELATRAQPCSRPNDSPHVPVPLSQTPVASARARHASPSEPKRRRPGTTSSGMLGARGLPRGFAMLGVGARPPSISLPRLLRIADGVFDPCSPASAGQLVPGHFDCIIWIPQRLPGLLPFSLQPESRHAP